MKKIWKELFAFLMALVLFTTAHGTVFAEGVSVNGKTVSGDTNNCVVISVTTKKKTTLSFTQTKGRVGYAYMLTGSKIIDSYGDFFAYVKDDSGEESPKTYSCSFKKSMSIPLSAKKTYTITICPRQNCITYWKMKNAGKLTGEASWGNENSFFWEKAATWTATIKNAETVNLIKSQIV